MKPYSKEFRGQVLAACDKGRSTREVATYFDVSESWVRRIKQERRELNKTAPLLERRRTPLWAALADRMRELIQQKPDLTLRELKAELHTELSVPTLCAALKRLGLTVKKKSLSPRSGSGRTSQRREELQREQPLVNPDRLVFIDETWAKTNMTRPRGRAPKGQRVLASVPHRSLEDDDVPCSSSHDGPDCPIGCGWSHQRGVVPQLGATPLRSRFWNLEILW